MRTHPGKPLTSFSIYTGCSISDELFDSISNLMSLSAKRGYKYDR